MWLHTVKEQKGEALKVHWKCFSLEQAHSSQGPDFKLWEHPEVQSRSLRALQGAKCAQLQGEDLFDTFHLRVFEALHRDQKNIASEAVLKKIADEVHLDTEAFLQDLRSDCSRQMVGDDHREAIDTFKVFGVPTFVYNQQCPSFIKIGSLPQSTEQQVHLFEQVQGLITGQPHILEIKRT